MHVLSCAHEAYIEQFTLTATNETLISTPSSFWCWSTALHDALTTAAGRLHAVDLTKMGEIIVRFCWFRAAVIFLIVIVAVLIFTFTRPLQVPNSTTYLAGLQILGYCITLVLVLVGFDFFYEAISIGSASKNYNSTRELKYSFHTYIVCFFVIASSLIQMWAFQ